MLALHSVTTIKGSYLVILEQNRTVGTVLFTSYEYMLMMEIEEVYLVLSCLYYSTVCFYHFVI